MGIVGTLTLFGLAAPTLAAAPTVQGYLAKQALPVGSLVSLDANPGIVQAATNQNVESLVGVAAAGDNSSLGESVAAGQIPVATGGATDTLVSDLEGDIRVGDRITASAVSGVGAKATASARIVGVAQGSFDARTAGAITTTITESNSHKKDIHVGRIPVLVNVTYYTASQSPSTAKSGNPSALEKAANALAGKTVSLFALAFAGLVLFVAIVAAAVILYGSTRGSIVAVGRNPLARKLIATSLFEAMGAGVVILVAGIAGAFVILKFL